MNYPRPCVAPKLSVFLMVMATTAASSASADPIAGLPYKASPIAPNRPQCSLDRNDEPGDFIPMSDAQYKAVQNRLQVIVNEELKNHFTNPRHYQRIRRDSKADIPDLAEKEAYYAREAGRMSSEAEGFFKTYFTGECAMDSFRCRQNFFAQLSEIVPVSEWRYEVKKGSPEAPPSMIANKVVSSLGGKLFDQLNPKGSLYCGKSSSGAFWLNKPETVQFVKTPRAKKPEKNPPLHAAVSPCESSDEFTLDVESIFETGKSELSPQSEAKLTEALQKAMKQFTSEGKRLQGYWVKASASRSYNTKRYTSEDAAYRMNYSLAEKRQEVLSQKMGELMMTETITRFGGAHQFVELKPKPGETAVVVAGPAFDPATDSSLDAKYLEHQFTRVTFLVATPKTIGCPEVDPNTRVSDHQQSKPLMRELDDKVYDKAYDQAEPSSSRKGGRKVRKVTRHLRPTKQVKPEASAELERLPASDSSTR